MSETMDLERSVLERKERDELATIAGALGMKPGARAKKETLIDQILRGAGVGSNTGVGTNAGSSSGSADALQGSVAAKPKRVTRARKAVAESHSDGGADAAANGAKADPAPVEASAPSGRPRSARSGSATRSATLFDPFAEATQSAPLDRSEEEAGLSAAARNRNGAGDGGGGGNSATVVVPTPASLEDSSQSASSNSASSSGSNNGERPARPPREDRAGRDRNRGERPPNQGTNGGGHGAQGNSNQGPQGNNRDRFLNNDDGPGRRNRRRRGQNRDRQVTPQADAQVDKASENYQGELIDITGLLDLSDQGYGYIRAVGYLPNARDVYVPVNRVRQLGLRKGDTVVGAHRPALPQEKFPAIMRIDTVNGHHPDVARLRPRFEDLTPLFPDVKLRLETPGQSGNMVARIIDLVSPIGKGQRGLIVSPPKAGKTTIMKQIATSIEANNPEVHLMVLLVDERPEEVTDMRRHVKGEVVASTFDKPSDEHTQVAELAIERAKRLVEEGRDVVIILDGITRLARAYNLAAPATGRIMSGGIDTGALYPPKKFFGAARNIEEGGSLTILATALIETGSTMDTVIFEEFKGTGNMELRLDRRLAEKRIYPAINVNESSTRHEELLFDRKELDVVFRLRRVLNGLAEDGGAAKSLELLMERMKVTRTNADFMAEIAKAPGA